MLIATVIAMPTPEHPNLGSFVNEARADEGPNNAQRYTLEELARAVGMSSRNIRAHQTRRLLDPPVRSGRTAYYDDRHLRRLMHIRTLQEQGFNLVAIEAVLAGPAETGRAEPRLAAQEPAARAPGDPADHHRRDRPAADDLGSMLHRIAVGHPRLIQALTRHGVVRRGPDGTVRPVQDRLLQSAFGLDRAGLSPALSLQVLAEVLDSLRPLVDQLGQATSARIFALSHHSGHATVPAAGRLDREGLHPGLGDLLTEVFRVTVRDPQDAGMKAGQRV